MFKAAVIVCVLAAACSAAPPAGRRWLKGRIVGGEPVDISQYPWQVSLQHLEVHDCGGAIIATNWVLTAASCLYDRDIWEFTVRAGTSTRESGGVAFGVAAGHVNEAYNNVSGDNDIAAISISGHFDFGTNVQAASVGSSEPEGGALVTVSGWGAPSSGAAASEQLQAVSVPVVDRDACSASWSVTENMICAGGEGAGVCDGDKGNPLVADSTLVGLASQGNCATAGVPEVYTSVAALRTWIKETTGV